MLDLLANTGLGSCLVIIIGMAAITALFTKASK